MSRMPLSVEQKFANINADIALAEDLHWQVTAQSILAAQCIVDFDAPDASVRAVYKQSPPTGLWRFSHGRLLTRDGQRTTFLSRKKLRELLTTRQPTAN